MTTSKEDDDQDEKWDPVGPKAIVVRRKNSYKNYSPSEKARLWKEYEAACSVRKGTAWLKANRLSRTTVEYHFAPPMTQAECAEKDRWNASLREEEMERHDLRLRQQLGDRLGVNASIEGPKLAVVAAELIELRLQSITLNYELSPEFGMLASQRKAELDAARFVAVRNLAYMIYKRTDGSALMGYKETLDNRELVKKTIINYEITQGLLRNDLGAALPQTQPANQTPETLPGGEESTRGGRQGHTHLRLVPRPHE